VTAFQFKRAIREEVGLIVGVAGGTGSGKTFSSLRMAAGISGDKPFAVIDTEAGRCKHYADKFSFDHGDLHAPFSPEAYTEAILAADAARYPCIVVDSMSHEWASEGGVLEMQESELDRMAGNDWQKREQCKMAAWIKPKMAHKKMVQRLLQVRAHLILCFRAEEKVDMVRDSKGKMQIVPKVTKTGLDGWVPICEKALPFELTASFLLTNDAPGMPKPIKLQEQHRAMFPLDKPINEESGRKITAWASGTASPPPTRTAGMTDDEVGALVATLDVKTLPELKTAFESAWPKTKGDTAARQKLQSNYDTMKAAIQAGTI
jgi:hypothetical protein